MRLHLCFLIGSTGLLGGCETTSAPPKPASLPRATEQQRELYERAIALFRTGDEEFAAVLREGRDDSVLAKALTMFLVFHMRDAELRQRQQQRNRMGGRTLEDNVRYTQARAGLGTLGEAALPTVRTELIQHRFTETRLFGIRILTALGADAVPAIREVMRASKPKYRRYYVEAVSGMPNSPKVELQLLEWSKDPDFTVRTKALIGLIRFGKRHLSLMREVVISDPVQFVRRQVIQNLGSYRDATTVGVVLDFYARCTKIGDDRGGREAERTLMQMSGKQPKRIGQRMKAYGLVYWRKWADSQRQENR